MRYSAKQMQQMRRLNFSGNIIPPTWFQNVHMENGKPDLVGIILLSDIVYWYRPVEVRSEKTGKLIGYKPKFKADKLQRGYGALAEQYGFTKLQVKDALRRLENVGVIELEFRHPTFRGVKCGNVLYIGLNIDKLETLMSYPDSEEEDDGYVSCEEIEEAIEAEEGATNTPPIDFKVNRVRVLKSIPSEGVDTQVGYTDVDTNTRDLTETKTESKQTTPCGGALPSDKFFQDDDVELEFFKDISISVKRDAGFSEPETVPFGENEIPLSETTPEEKYRQRASEALQRGFKRHMERKSSSPTVPFAFPEDVAVFAREFVDASGIVPTIRERAYWINSLRELVNLNITVGELRAAVSQMRCTGLTIKSPASIFAIVRNSHAAKNVDLDKIASEVY